MKFELTPPQKEIQMKARLFAREEVAPLARRADETGQFPTSLIPRMAELGFLAGPLEPRYGGGGMDYPSFALVYEELGWADASVRGFLAGHTGLVSLCIREWGTRDQKQRYLPALAAGDLIGCYCLTEAKAGSDIAAMEATAREERDGYILDGEKIWVAHAGLADVALVFASQDRLARQNGLCAFIVETDTPGFHREPMPGRKLGHRASGHTRITLEGCRLPREALVGEAGQGFKIALSALDHGRLGAAAGAVGLLQACLDASLDFVRRRRQFGQRLGDFQMIQSSIADMTVDLEAARLLVYRAAWLKEQGLPATRATAVAKLFATEAALKAASEAVLLHGGRGYSNEYPVERHYRDIKALQIWEGTSHIQRLTIAHEVIGPEK